MYVFKLTFKSALHVDSKGSGEPVSAQEFIHSDTLSAAIALAWAELFEERSEEFFLNLPFQVSSGFPYVKDVLLFPLPCWDVWAKPKQEQSEKQEVKQRKKIKKIKWISKSLFEDLLNGNQLTSQEILDNAIEGIAFSQAEKEKLADLGEKFWVISERQRVKIDRLGLKQEGGLFFFGLQFFAPGCGLYFLADVAKDKLDKLKAAITFLGDTGLGADRNCGLGHFQLQNVTKLCLNLPSKNNSWTILSLFNPDPTEDDLKNLTQYSAYNILERSGWIVHSTLGRPPVMVFAEGSFFSAQPKGRILPLLDQNIREKNKLNLSHSAPRDFRAFALPSQVNTGE